MSRCCAAPGWVSAVAAGRPYATYEELLDRADTALADLDDTGVAAALAGHPRIGERIEGSNGAWSHGEQAGMETAEQALRVALRDGNQAYEARFGHVYLVCATGLSASQLMHRLHERLGNDAETERRVVRAELGKINRVRLQKLVGA